MIIPVRCFSCSKPVGHLHNEFTEKVERGENTKKVFENLGLDRFCCRALFMGHVDLIDAAGEFKRG